MKAKHAYIAVGALVAVLAAVLYLAQLKDPSGAAVGGGCGGSPIDSELIGDDGEPVTLEYNSDALEAELHEALPVTSLSGNLLSYVYSMYDYVGQAELFEQPEFFMVDAARIVQLYDGQYSADSPNLPTGTIRKGQGGRIIIYLRQGIPASDLLRTIHHEMGDVYVFTQKGGKIESQYWSELNRVYMTLVAMAHDPAIGAWLAPSYTWTLPTDPSGYKSYHLGFLMALHLLGETGFNLDAAQAVLAEKTLEELDTAAQQFIGQQALATVLIGLDKIRENNPYNFTDEYIDYLKAVAQLNALFEDMLSTYNAEENESALEVAVEIAKLLTPYPSSEFPSVLEKHLIAYNMAASLYLDKSDHEGVRVVTEAYWSKFEPFLAGETRDDMFKERGPSTLFARAAAESYASDVPAIRLWAERVIAFEQWFEYEPESVGAQRIQKAKDLLDAYPTP
jgi:hypothetical protein